MKKLLPCLLVSLLVVGCRRSDYDSFNNTTDAIMAQENSSSQVKLTPTEPFYPQPDFNSDRYFKVEDQYGCKWWINSGHKFDGEYIALNDKNEADCRDRDYAPTREIHWLDSENVLRQVTYEEKAYVNQEKK